MTTPSNRRTIPGMEKLGRWWNGKWGRLARRRVALDRTADGYQVTAQEGTDEKGTERVWVLPDEATARRLIADLTEVTPDDPLSEGWREMPIELYR
jgi:hypothetical protein